MNTFILKWQGPYNDDTIRQVRKIKGLYLITGYQKFKRIKAMQFSGICESRHFLTERLRNESKHFVLRDAQYWVAMLVSEKEITRTELELVESMINNFWRPELSSIKQFHMGEPTLLINRWYNTQGMLRRKITNKEQKVSDIIYWDGTTWLLADRLRQI
ncbi:MAG: hypothetical protein WCQ95_11070 [Bacteroidota bacterium]